MVNSQVVNEIVNALKLDLRVDNIPNALPVIEVGTKTVKKGFTRAGTITNSSTPLTLFTAPSDQDTYLTGATLSCTKDVTSTQLQAAVIYIDENGISQNFLQLAGLSLTPSYLATVTPTMHPVKVQRGSVITLKSDTAVANFNCKAAIYGFLDEVN